MTPTGLVTTRFSSACPYLKYSTAKPKVQGTSKGPAEVDNVMTVSDGLPDLSQQSSNERDLPKGAGILHMSVLPLEKEKRRAEAPVGSVPWLVQPEPGWVHGVPTGVGPSPTRAGRYDDDKPSGRADPHDGGTAISGLGRIIARTGSSDAGSHSGRNRPTSCQPRLT